MNMLKDDKYGWLCNVYGLFLTFILCGINFCGEALFLLSGQKNNDTTEKRYLNIRI